VLVICTAENREPATTRISLGALKMAYHSAFNEVEAPDVCGCPLLPLGGDSDIVDEVIGAIHQSRRMFSKVDGVCFSAHAEPQAYVSVVL